MSFSPVFVMSMHTYWYFALWILPVLICHLSSIIHSDWGVGAATVSPLFHFHLSALRPCSSPVSIFEIYGLVWWLSSSRTAHNSHDRGVNFCLRLQASIQQDSSLPFNFYRRWAVKEWKKFSHKLHPNSQIPHISLHASWCYQSCIVMS